MKSLLCLLNNYRSANLVSVIVSMLRVIEGLHYNHVHLLTTCLARMPDVHCNVVNSFTASMSRCLCLLAA